jgi:IclR family transcriptional regulator, blcABC operon repressor
VRRLGSDEGAQSTPTRSDGERAAPGQLVPSVVRAADLLETLAAGPPIATLASLSRRLALPRSSALALCNTLVHTGLMTRERDGYRLGPGVVALSRAYLTQTDLYTEFDRLARGLAVLPEETLVLSVRDATDVVYIGRRIGNRPVGVSYEVGLRLPAHCTASGKALLSSLTSEEVRELYGSDAQLKSLTPQTITDVSALVRDLSKANGRGYAVDDEETAPGMMCVGAAIRDRTGRGAGAVAVSMVKAAMADDALSTVAAEMRRLADRISTALGATAPV